MAGLGMAVGVLAVISLVVATPIIAGISERSGGRGGTLVPLALGTAGLPAAPKLSAPTSAWLRWSVLEQRSVESMNWSGARNCSISSVSYLQERADMLVARAPAWLLVAGGESITGRCEIPLQSGRGRPEWPFPVLGALLVHGLASSNHVARLQRRCHRR